MNRKWGREETYYWPSHKPLWTISALVIGVLVFVGMAIYQAELRWTPLQRYWFPNYFKMDLAAGLGLASGNYRLPEVEDHLGRRRLALETDVVPWEGSLPQAGTIPLILSDEARRQGLRLVLEPKGQYKNKELRDYVRHWVYQDQTWGDFLYWPLVTGGAVFCWILMFAIPKDWQRRRVLKYGRRTKGPVFATAAQFNCRRERANRRREILQPFPAAEVHTDCRHPKHQFAKVCIARRHVADTPSNF